MKNRGHLGSLVSICLVLIISLVFIFGGCGQSATPSTTSTPPQTTAQTSTVPTSTTTPPAPSTVVPSPSTQAPPQVIKMGYSIPLNMSYGVGVKKALDVYLPQFNQTGITIKGQKYIVELDIRDDESKPDLGRTNAEYFVQAKLNYVVYIGSATTVAAATVTEAANVLMFSGASTDQHLLAPAKYTFRSAESYHSKSIKWKFIRDHFPNAKTVGIFEQDNESGKVDAARCKQIAPVYNLSLPDSNVLFYPAGASDFTAIATKMVSINPDIIVFAATEAETAIGLQVKALRAAGYKGGLAKTEELNITELKQVASLTDIEGMIAKCQPDAMPDTSKAFNDFKTAYIAKYGDWPTIYYGFLAFLPMFKAAAEKANSLEVPNVAAAISGLEWVHLSGPFATFYREDIKLDRPVGVESVAPMGVIKNGVLTWEKTYTLAECTAANNSVYGVTKWGKAGPPK